MLGAPTTSGPHEWRTGMCLAPRYTTVAVGSVDEIKAHPAAWCCFATGCRAITALRVCNDFEKNATKYGFAMRMRVVE